MIAEPGVRFTAGKCSAKFGQFYASLLPPKQFFTPPDESETLPWACIGSVFVTFTIGEAQVSKKITAKATGSYDDEISDAEKWALASKMDSEMKRLIARHGIQFGYAIRWDFK